LGKGHPQEAVVGTVNKAAQRTLCHVVRMRFEL